MSSIVLTPIGQTDFYYDTLDRVIKEEWVRPNPLTQVRTIWLEYDKLGRITKQTDSGNNQGGPYDDLVNTYQYDGLGRLTEEANYEPSDLTQGQNTGLPRVRQTYQYVFETDSSGMWPFYERVYRNQQQHTTGGLVAVAETQFQYDRLGQLIDQADYDGNSTAGPVVEYKHLRFAYDTADNLDSITHFANYVSGTWQNVFDTDLVYDKAGRLTSIRHDLATDIVHTYGYDNASRVTSFNTTGSGAATRSYTYDDAGQLTAKTGGTGEAYIYDDNGNRVAVDGQSNMTGRGNRLLDDGTYYYEYDAEGNLTRRTSIDGSEVTLYRWDHRNRLVSVETFQPQPGMDFSTASVAAYSTGQDGAGGIPSSFTVEDDGETVHLAGNTWKWISLSSVGLPSSITVTADTVLSFDFYSPAAPEGAAIGLDSDNTHTNPIRFWQLSGRDAPGTGVLLPGVSYRGAWQHYEIRLADFAGAYSIGQVLNRLTFVNDDDAGGGGESYFRHIRLTEGPSLQPPSESISYLYDAEGRRVKRVHDPDGAGAAVAANEYFVYEGDELAMQFGHAGELTHRYLYGPAVDQVLVDEVFNAFNEAGEPTETLWLLGDQQGTIRDIVNDYGELRKHLDYGSFGNITDEDFYDWGGFLTTSSDEQAVDQLFYFTGQERDEVTGLQKHGNDPGRWYDPSMGRWLSEDPAGFDAGDANLYRYVGNDPLNATDPTGLVQAGNPLANLPSVSKPFSSQAALPKSTPAVDYAVKQINQLLNPTPSAIDIARATPLPSVDYYNNLTQGDYYNNLARSPGREVVSVEVVPGIHAGDVVRNTYNSLAAGFQTTANRTDSALSAFANQYAASAIRTFGRIEGAITDVFLPASDPDIIVHRADGTTTVGIGAGPTTGALAGQGLAYGPPVLQGASRPGGQLVFGAAERIAPTTQQQLTSSIGELRAAGLRDAHHVIQDAAVRNLSGYDSNLARGVQLPGPSTARGTPHFEATQVQRQTGGGTYAAERRIGYKALRRAGYSDGDARQIIQETDDYFRSLGVTPQTPTRIPGNRR